ncbi:hypothetical protein BOX15_Mlig001330g1 [Macrostomum lignano]|uniref:Uncharacterized protein n=2 Tax=Macrostomum lignano TaxID=282301 RepID=A0A267DSM2_9PLAT|nr:hypothetical protein BOX15_Mlig001330g1 [Macrostomum lignano]
MSINQDNHQNAPMLPTDLALDSMSGVKPDEKLSSATAVASKEDAVGPPSVPDCELEESGNDQNQCSRIQQSCPQLPQFETRETLPVLLLDTHHSGSQVEFPSGESCNRRFKFDSQKADSVESYHQTVKNFMSDAKSQKACEALIVHKIDVTANCMQPMLSGKIVTEDELNKPLYSRQSSEPIKIRVTYLLCPTECTGVDSDSVEQGVGKTGSGDDEAPKCPSLCNAEIYYLLKPNFGEPNFGEPNWQWQDVHQALDKSVTTDRLADRIANCCRCSQRRMSGVPSGKLAEVAASVENAEAPPIPTVSDDQGNPLEQLDALNSKPSYEWAEPNAFVSVIIGKYEKDSSEKDRVGFEKDKKNFRKIAKQLGCLSENVRSLCPDDGYVSAEKALQFVDNYAQEWRNKSTTPRCLFVAISAHGCEAGIRTSDGKIVSVEELMKKVENLAGFVLLFYQACRGPRFHAAQAGQNHRPAFACCLGFVSPPKAAGCTLPPEMEAAAAIFASMAGYEAYRNEDEGSWMPQALLNVVRRRGRITVKRLADLLQAELHQLLKLGIVPLRQKGKSYTAYVQTQYSANQGFENFVIETGLGGGGRGTTAAREKLARLELNNPECTGQPD